VGRLRLDLDAVEHGLIERAREGAVSWPRIAQALGLASRQAAEQRWLRLGTKSGRDPRQARMARERQQIADALSGRSVGDLRAAIRGARRRILADQVWDARHPRAALARTSLDEAAEAAPGPMFDLVTAALEDIAAIPSELLPAGMEPFVARLREATATVHAGSKG
jgi:hypothetical protein